MSKLFLDEVQHEFVLLVMLRTESRFTYVAIIITVMILVWFNNE